MPVEEISERDDNVERFLEFSVAKIGKRGNKLVSQPQPRPRNRVRLSTIQEDDEWMLLVVIFFLTKIFWSIIVDCTKQLQI